MNETPATPAQIDDLIADLHKQITARESDAAHALDSIHRIAGDHKTRGPFAHWGMSHDEATEAARGACPDTTTTHEKTIAQAKAKIADLEAELAPLDAEYERRGGWSRFYLVQNTGGHIHSSTDCSTCNRNLKATQFGWLTDLSGMSEGDAVKAHGAILCTVCFPSAPLEWTNQYEVEAAKKKAARCSGSGTYLDSSKPHRKGYYSGNWGTCPDCGGKITLTPNLNLRSHKPEKG